MRNWVFLCGLNGQLEHILALAWPFSTYRVSFFCVLEYAHTHYCVSVWVCVCLSVKCCICTTLWRTPPGSYCTMPRRAQARYFHLLTTEILLGVCVGVSVCVRAWMWCVCVCVCSSSSIWMVNGGDMSPWALQHREEIHFCVADRDGGRLFLIWHSIIQI